MAPTISDFGEVLEGIPPGAWVALSNDEKRVVAYAAEMRDAIKEANDKGEEHPVILRVPISPAALCL